MVKAKLKFPNDYKWHNHHKMYVPLEEHEYKDEMCHRCGYMPTTWSRYDQEKHSIEDCIEHLRNQIETIVKLVPGLIKE